MTEVISSQDFRNLYEKYYNRIRIYLWPYSTLEVLADVECDIYSAFIDYASLKAHLDKLYQLTREAMEDDQLLREAYDDLVSLLNEVDENTKSYLSVYQVEEADPELDKQMKVEDKEEETEDEDNKETIYQGM